MKRIINLTSLFITTLLCSCVDYAGGATAAFANDSSHHIQMIDFAKPDDEVFAAGIEIFPGEEVIFKSEGFWASHRSLDSDDAEILGFLRNILPNGVTVIFDNQYAITYSWNGEFTALCYPEKYIPTRTSSTRWKYTYHFTDEDYEYAKEYGEVLE